MAIRAVVFDIGGVLLNYVDTGMEEKWQQRLGISSFELEARLIVSKTGNEASLGIIDEQEIARRLATALCIDDAGAREFMDDRWAQYELNTELADFFASLRPRYKTATVSNEWSGARRELCTRYHLDRYVDTMIFSSEEGMGKPDACFFQFVCDRLAVKPDEVLFVDDSFENCRAADKLGMWTILFRTTEDTINGIHQYFEADRKDCGEA